MKLEFGYGRGKQQAEISERNLLGILKPNVIRAERSQEDEVRYALEHPIGSSMLNDIVKPGEKIVLITSDITRGTFYAMNLDVLEDGSGMRG